MGNAKIGEEVIDDQICRGFEEAKVRDERERKEKKKKG